MRRGRGLPFGPLLRRLLFDPNLTPNFPPQVYRTFRLEFGPLDRLETIDQGAASQSRKKECRRSRLDRKDSFRHLSLLGCPSL